ncbi:hypothetical protein [Vibrio marinisediminis]|uniref:hypothetical protein n=1 Tax=Vibrio marinisediminis TaxID=2758441 RepID=UPI001FE87D81|nr:hypothetical protein [Vibrio marinisediminis]
MGKSHAVIWAGIFFSISLLPKVLAESISSYPPGWEYWPEVKETMIYPAASELPSNISLFSQESLRAYNWVNQSQGTVVTIRVHPDKMNQYLTHGPYSDGPTIVAVSEDAQMIWVTEHLGGEAIFGSYNTKGQDISHTHQTLKPEYCDRCHVSYQEFCPHGVCSDFDEHFTNIR